MSEPKIQLRGGIEVRNRKGQVFFWLKQKNPEMAHSYVLFTYKREMLEPDEVEKGDLAFAYAKEIAKSFGMPMYDFDEMEPQLKDHMKMIAEELKGRKIIRTRREEDIDLNVTDVVTGRKHTLIVGVKTKPMEEAKKEGLI